MNEISFILIQISLEFVCEGQIKKKMFHNVM